VRLIVNAICATVRQHYELRADDAIVATLIFRSAWGSFATAESADGCWTFKRVGFWQTRTTVRRCDSTDDLATFQHKTWSGGGSLTLSDGRAFHLTSNTWQTKLDVLDSQQNSLLHYASTGLFKLGATLTVEPHARANTELPWLALFGWYVLVMMYHDAAATAATTAAIS
jgi:hypothetical protein